MLTIEKHKNGNDYDVICLKTNEGEFRISFEDNFDLYWTYIPEKSILDSETTHEFTITKENYYIYNVFDKLFNSVKDNKLYSNYLYDNNFKHGRFECFNKNNSYNLFNNGMIEWHSDDFEYDIASCVSIVKFDDESFKIIFKRNNIFKTYAIRFSNSGSRYEPFNILFMNMYNELKNYNHEYHQIHIEEYMYKQKVLEKK